VKLRGVTKTRRCQAIHPVTPKGCSEGCSGSRSTPCPSALHQLLLRRCPRRVLNDTREKSRHFGDRLRTCARYRQVPPERAHPAQGLGSSATPAKQQLNEVLELPTNQREAFAAKLLEKLDAAPDSRTDASGLPRSSGAPAKLSTPGGRGAAGKRCARGSSGLCARRAALQNSGNAAEWYERKRRPRARGRSRRASPQGPRPPTRRVAAPLPTTSRRCSRRARADH
jgi:hypothetical protein